MLRKSCVRKDIMNGNEVPPCKVNKCICYPACIDKAHVNCDELKDYYVRMVVVNTRLANCNSKVWGNIKMFLPNLHTIKSSADIPTPDGRSSCTRFNMMDLK